MYRVELDPSNLRYAVTCLILKENDKTEWPSWGDVIIDTGAQRTAYQASFISTKLLEEDFKNNEAIAIGGFVDGDKKQQKAVFYKLRVAKFNLGNIELQDQDIWITFDKRVTQNVVGMDILRQLSFLQIENNDELIFFDNARELADYISNINP